VKLPTLPNLDGLIGLARQDGVDVRPTLVRVLTDLYIQRRGHTLEEEHRYTELALWLLAAVDAPTRAAVAHKLADYDEAPHLVVRRLARDTYEVAEPILTRSTRLQSEDLLAILKDFGPRHAAAIGRRNNPGHADAAASAQTPRPAEAAVVRGDVAPVMTAPNTTTAPAAEESASAETEAPVSPTSTVPLGDYFLNAGSAERRLLLANLEDGTLTPAEQAFAADTDDAARALEAAALGRRPDEFIRGLEHALRIVADKAQRIVRDDTGEPLLVAMKALGMPSDTLLRVLLFLNPVIGHSVERVFDLVNLFDRLSVEAAHHLVSSWQHPARRDQARYQPATWDDERRGARRTLAEHPRRSFPVQVPDGRDDVRVPVRGQRG
jgi:uncharacterized protein (DUF2336 family)